MAYQRLGSLLTKSYMAGILDALELLALHQLGRGILSGLAISAGAGLSLTIGSGVILGLSAKAYAGGSALMPASSTVYVWISLDGVVTTSVAATDPGGELVCLGRVTTSGSAITAVTSELRMELPRMTALREWRGGGLRTDISTNAVGFFGAAPAAKVVVSDPAATGNTDGEIGGLAIGAAYSQAEVQALRDKCEELADDVRALRGTVAALVDALQGYGLV